MKTWDTVAIVGVGLLGGSLGLALRERELAREVIGIGRRATSLRAAKRVGAVTRTSMDLPAAVQRAELVVICTPVDQVPEFARQAAWHAAEGAVITDVGSTKQAIVAGMDQALASHNPRRAAFVGSHPMAGGEKHGPQFARADLFEKRVVVVTSTSATDSAARRTVERLWKGVGARVVKLSPKEHDQAVASISHMPHVLATVIATATDPDSLPLAAGGWLDTTRIASGDPTLWTQILTQNRLNVLESLDAVESTLAEFRRALVYDDQAKIQQLLEAGKRVRDAAN